MNVILVSTEDTFPVRMWNNLKFDRSNFSRIIYAGEVKPSKMYELLTEHWGLGPHLSTALIDQFGGHIHDISLAMGFTFSSVKIENNQCTLRKIIYPFSMSNEKVNVLLFGSAKDTKLVLQIYKDLAVKGYHLYSGPDIANDPDCNYISEHNIGCVVTNDKSVVIGYPELSEGTYCYDL